MSYKALYFALLAVLSGVLAHLFLSSSSLDRESFTSKRLSAEVSITVEGERVPSETLKVSHSPRIHRVLNLPYVVGGVVGIGLLFGAVATVREKRTKHASSETGAEPARAEQLR